MSFSKPPTCCGVGHVEIIRLINTCTRWQSIARQRLNRQRRDHARPLCNYSRVIFQPLSSLLGLWSAGVSCSPRWTSTSPGAISMLCPRTKPNDGGGARYKEAQRIHRDERLGYCSQGSGEVGGQAARDCNKPIRGLLSLGSEKDAAS